MANDDVAQQITKAFDGISSGIKIASRKKILKDLLEKGYLSFYKKASVDLFMQEHKDEGYEVNRENGEYRVYSTDKEFNELKFMNEEKLNYLCGLLKIFKDLRPLSIFFTNNNDDTISYSLVSYNIENNSTTVLEQGTIPYSTEFKIKALPVILVYMKKYNETSIVFEDEEKFKLNSAVDKEKSYVIFRGFKFEQQKSIYEMRNLVNTFVTGKNQEYKPSDFIFTGEKETQEKLLEDSNDKKNADIIINNYMSSASKVDGPLYVSIVKDSSGLAKYKLGYFDITNKKIVPLMERPIDFYGEFRTRVLPYLNRELKARGNLETIPVYDKFDEKMVTSKHNFGQSSIMILNGFTPEEVEYINNSLEEPKEKEKQNEVRKEFFRKYPDYDKMIMDIVNKYGYLKFTLEEFTEFARKFYIKEWDSTIKDDTVYVYPSMKTLYHADKSINASIYAAVRQAVEENDGTLSVVVDRLKDGSCKVEVNSYNKTTNSVKNLTKVRLMFEGDFLHNVLPFLSNALPILGPVSYKEFNLINFIDEIPMEMLKNKSVVMFKGLTPEMSKQLHEVIQFGDKVYFNSITK